MGRLALFLSPTVGGAGRVLCEREGVGEADKGGGEGSRASTHLYWVCILHIFLWKRYTFRKLSDLVGHNL